MATAKDNQEFRDSLITSSPLDEAIDYCKGHLHPNDVFDDDELQTFVRNNYPIDDTYGETEIQNYARRSFTPEQVFEVDALSDWAEANGYRKE